MSRTARCLSLLMLSVTLSACGGGGGEAETPAPGPGGGTPAPAPAQVAAREIVLQLRPGHDIAAVAADYRLQPVARFGQRPIHRLQTTGGESVDAVLPQLQADARVLYAEANLVSETPEGRRGSVWAIGEAGDYQSQWVPQALRLPQAHAVSEGAGVRVAVLDTGVDLDHPA
jgi:hypothetical protein